MRSLQIVIAATLLLAAVPVGAQDRAQEKGASAPRTASPRGRVPDQGPASGPHGTPIAAARAAEAPASSPAADEQRRGGGDERRAEPRGSRPREDNPPAGVAVPRDANRQPVPNGEGNRDRDRYYGSRPPVYNNYYPNYYYPRSAWPYGYGGFGLGYFYYDPYTWYGPSYYSGFYNPYFVPGVSYNGAYTGPRSGYPIGYVRLRVEPRDAQVFVDGYYAGVVDDFDGTFQSLNLEDGSHHIEIRLPGATPLTFDVNVLPGQKITYRGDLKVPQP